MRKKYVWLLTEKTKCNNCRQPVVMLTPQSNFESGPTFYICFNCKNIAQCGVGPVEQED